MEERIIDSKPQNDIYDTEIILESTPGGNLTFRDYREILTFDEDGEPVTFITSIFNLATESSMKIQTFTVIFPRDFLVEKRYYKF